MAAAFQTDAFQNNAFEVPAGHVCPDPTKSYVGSYVATAINDGCIDGLICAPSVATQPITEPGGTQWQLRS